MKMKHLEEYLACYKITSTNTLQYSYQRDIYLILFLCWEVTDESHDEKTFVLGCLIRKWNTYKSLYAVIQYKGQNASEMQNLVYFTGDSNTITQGSRYKRSLSKTTTF